MRKLITLFFLVSIIGFVSSRGFVNDKSKSTVPKTTVLKDSSRTQKDTTKIEVVKFYKKDAHASYYHDKFNGRRTASGKRFDNNEYTAAHRKFPFGTKLKITNQASGKSITVEVNDRGPFSRGREIDLSKRAFMEIAKNKGIGVMTVTIEEVIK